MRVVLLHTESPYQDDEQLERAAHADLNLLNDPVNIAAYRDLGVPAEYMPHAYREAIHYPEPAEKKWDLSFIGTGYPSRVRFFEAMRLDGLAVHLAGPWLGLPEDSPLRDWAMTEDEACVSNDETAGIYRASRCGINVYRRESRAGPRRGRVGRRPREVELAACGPGSPATPAANPTRCSPCSRRSLTLLRPGIRSGGRSHTRKPGRRQPRRPGRRSRAGRSATTRNGCSPY
jgi:hypothetical protein